MHKSRRAVKVPRRKASEQNQAPTLIIVRDCNSECFIDRTLGNPREKEQVKRNQDK